MASKESKSIRYVSIDQMLPYVGEFGRFQWILDGIFCSMMLPQTYQVLIMYFAALSPTWKCATNSTICTSNGTFANNNNTRCDMPRNAWEFTEPKDFSIVTQFDIYCDKEWQIHLTTSVLFISWAFGAVVLGWLADNFGRKSVVFPSIAIIIIAGFITSFLPNIYWFIVFRLIVGFFTPGTSVQEFILISEVVGSKYRPLAGMVLWFVFTIALCALGLKAYLIRQWKYLFIACTIPYIFVLVFYKFVPESVRWLRLHGKNERLMELFRRIASWNKKEIPADIQVSSGSNNTAPPKSSPLDLFRTRTLAVQTSIQGYAWMVNGMVYYGISLASDDFGGSLYRNYVLVSAVEFPAVIAAIYLCEKVGRKKTVIPSLFIGSVACIIVAFVPTTGNAKIVSIVLGMIGKLFITISFDSLYTWSVEIYPTSIRSGGMGFLQVTSRIGAATSPWIAKGLKVVHRSVPFVVMGSAALIACGLLFVLPETKGVATAETADEDEKVSEDAADKIEMDNKAYDGE